MIYNRITMDKKVKSLDITTLLSLVFYIAGIAFCIMGYVFMTKEGGEFGLSNIDLTSSDGRGVAQLLFIVGCAFLGLGVISGIVIGIMYIITDWGNDELKKKTKIAGILNLFPFCFSIPANVVTRSLVKQFVHDEPNPKKSKKEKKEKEEAKPAQQSTTTQSTTTQTNTGSTLQQPQQQTQSFGVQQPSAGFVAPINQSFQYNGKWMFFDGTTYYEADANNQWVVSSTIPR